MDSSPPRAQFGLGTVGLVAALAAATAFALGRFTSQPAESHVIEAPPAVEQSEPGRSEQLPPGHPPVEGTGAAPHPTQAPQGMGAPAQGSGEARSLTWTKPTTWEDAPNTSSMRIATYRAVKVQGDPEAPLVTVMQAGGSLDANIERWADQFGEEGRKALKRSQRTLAGYPVTVVSTHGTYSGGMSAESDQAQAWGLLAAIVETPDMPFFFKMTGPQKSVEAAEKDFEALLSSFKKP